MSKLVPKLRFEGFSEEWKERSLDSITSKISDGIHTTPKYTEDGEYYFINGNNLVNGVITVDSKTKRVTENEYQQHKRDLDLNTILLSINGTIGNIAIYNNEKVVLGKSACYITIKDDLLNKYFIVNLLKTEKIQNYFTTELTGSTIKNLSLKTIKNTIIDLPKPKEQEKIANCLSSLDSLIEAQNKKVETLKEHKKGLMQQLFPSEGKTVPKLRFDGFSGEWEEKELGNIGKVSMCKRILKDQTSISGEIPFYKIGTFGKKADAFISMDIYERYKKQYSFPKKGDILISASGTIGRLVVYDGIPAYFQDSNIVWIANDEKIVENSFLFYCYKKVKWNTNDNTIARLYNDNLRSIKIFIPKEKEQQKIANCLSSLDSLIEAQNKKVEALKEHKKGLMQQLFVEGDLK